MALTHDKIEKRTGLLVILTLATVSIGGMVEIIPLYTIESTVEAVDGVRPYTPLELAGRDIYIREGCYTCHSQQVRPFRDEAERYGHYSLAAESKYDHPFQWGSKRTGPDLARVGGKYSNEWHVAHLYDPRALVPGSVMPTYGFLLNRPLETASMAGRLGANATVGVPYTAEMIDVALADMVAQADPMSDAEGLIARYPGARVDNYDGDTAKLTEMDALVAYLQVLGTMVRFNDLTVEELQQ
ncbi:cytochrome c oxidase, cbb3-type subunit II [Tistrella bauzanensis]|uniref:Cytochrome c oxidase, cbb3-type subunit II n=1 Tax=Tistrella bauzanensis TaxID=657419 RepID=A0ABQ1IMH7_9PROT|nr:cytochrome-c oxidase, cbb3-type subunit II [Tistrella bauzanensis]GGB47153.1 cytochrome c oxidase, cbb3-type subunit II [Tistrella bauzanensis]